MRWPMPSMRPSFGVDVDQFAGLLPLVADDRHWCVERSKPAEPQTAQRHAHRRDGPAEAACDRWSRQPLAAQALDLGFGRAVKPGRTGMRPRRPVSQSGRPFRRKPVPPFAHRPAVDVEGSRNRLHRPARFETFNSSPFDCAALFWHCHGCPSEGSWRSVARVVTATSHPVLRTDNLHSNDS